MDGFWKNIYFLPRGRRGVDDASAAAAAGGSRGAQVGRGRSEVKMSDHLGT